MSEMFRACGGEIETDIAGSEEATGGGGYMSEGLDEWDLFEDRMGYGLAYDSDFTHSNRSWLSSDDTELGSAGGADHNTVPLPLPCSYSSDDTDSSDDGLDEQDASDPPNVAEDPSFMTRSQLFPFHDSDCPCEVSLPPERTPRAFSEHPIVRLAYVRAFIASAFHGATQALTDSMLVGFKSTIHSFVSRDPNLAGFDLESFATTIATVERRLGVDTGTYIKYFFVCNLCWCRHEPEELYTLKSGSCSRHSCSGLLFTSKRLQNGLEKRIPVKILPYAKFIYAIQRILLRPGKWDDFQHWRGPEDVPGVVPPISFDEWKRNWPEDEPMCNIHDGWAWRALEAGLERRRGGRWKMEDVSVTEVSQRFVALPCGLVIAFNVDWYVCERLTTNDTYFFSGSKR